MTELNVHACGDPGYVFNELRAVERSAARPSAVTRLADTRPLRLFVTLACAFAAAAALPALAAGAPPGNDNIFQSFALNAPGTPLPTTTSRTGTIIEASVEGGEVIGCQRPGFPEVGFGDTVWWDFYPHRPGYIRVAAEAASFRTVVAVMPFNASTGTPDIGNYRCGVESLGTAILDYEFPVVEGAAYKIQVGAVNDATTTEGPYTLSVYFNADTDRDGVLDSADICPTLGGGAALGGCPDTDGDRKVDPQDACPGESTRGKRDRNDNGCPDRELLKPETKLTAGTFCTGSVCHGIRVQKLVVSEIPRGTKVSVSCTKHGCRKASKKAGKSRRVRFFSGKDLKAGVGLKITLSRQGFVSRQVTYWIQPNDFKKVTTCLKSGKPVKCTNSLLVR
jgi:hypothetical protein